MRMFSTIPLCLLATAIALSPRIAVAQEPDAPSGETRRLSVTDAVGLALEHNLGVQVARVNPLLQDLSIAQLRAAWAPSLTSSFGQSYTDTPASSFLSGSDLKTTDTRLTTNVGVRQSLGWGGSSYSLGWDNSRSTTTNFFSNFSPQLNSSLSFSFVQPLLKNFSIDNIRQQIKIGRNDRSNSDLDLEASIVGTTRSVRNAYWELAYAIESLEVQRQSLDLARESLRNNRARVEIGTMAPIDIVEAEAEVAHRDEAVILAEAAIDRTEDTLRALIYDPAMRGFWTVKIEPTDRPPFMPTPVDVDSAVSNALDRRTDLLQARKTIESSDISIRYFRNQTLPEINAQVDYGVSGIGGTQSIRGTGTGFIGPVIGTEIRPLSSVLSDVFTNDFPKWTVTLNVSYPLGASQPETSLARAKLQYSQSQTQLRNQQLQVSTQVRDAARSLTTNQKRVASTRASRGLQQRRLEAEEKKFSAGQSTSFFVFQAQRDLAVAQNNELRAILDYNKSRVDFETIQRVPLTSGGGGAVSRVNGATATGTGAPTARSTGGAPQQPGGF
jgi:outer membrane protein